MSFVDPAVMTPGALPGAVAGVPSVGIAGMPSVDIGGVTVVGGHGGVGDVLPFTGTGPGTLPLVVVGVVTIVVGALFALFGRRPPVRRHDDRWADLSPRANDV